MLLLNISKCIELQIHQTFIVISSGTSLQFLAYGCIVINESSQISMKCLQIVFSRTPSSGVQFSTQILVIFGAILFLILKNELLITIDQILECKIDENRFQRMIYLFLALYFYELHTSLLSGRGCTKTSHFYPFLW